MVRGRVTGVRSWARPEMGLSAMPAARSSLVAHCFSMAEEGCQAGRRSVFCLTRRREDAKKAFLSADYADYADYGGMSCRCAASHAAGFKTLFCLTRRREGAVVLWPTACRGLFCLTRRREEGKYEDEGGMSCRCAASHAAGFKALFCLTRRREGAKARKRHFWKMRLFLHEEEN